MGIIFLILLIATKQSIADIYELPDDEFFDHPINRDYEKYKETTVVQDEGNKIPYNDLLSLLHNGYSNTAVLANIGNPLLPQVEDLEKAIRKKPNTTHKNTVQNVIAPLNEGFNDVTRFAINEWNRLKRAYGAHNKAINDMKDIGDVASDFNRLRRDINAVNTVTVESDPDLNVVVSQLTKQDMGNMEKIKNEAAMINENNTRPRRSALKLLRELFQHSTTPKPVDKIAIPLNVRDLPDTDANPPTDLIGNLIDSIKILNEHLAHLKIDVNENIGFVMIKIPINDLQGMRYIKGMHKEINETKSKKFIARSKRDLTENVSEIKENSTLRNSTDHNVTKHDNGVIDEKEHIETTIISDSETNQQTINIPKEVNKPKRQTNVTITELNNSTNIDSTGNITEKETHVTNVTEKSVNVNTTESDINVTAIESKDLETKISRRAYSEPDDNILNNTDTIEARPKENTRKYLGNRDDLLFFIENTHAEIKNLISPIEDIRDKYSGTVLYKIGYIIANLDTMDSTLNKIKNRLYNNKGDTMRLQKVFKKLKMSKKLVESIMGYLNKFAENQSIIPH